MKSKNLDKKAKNIAKLFNSGQITLAKKLYEANKSIKYKHLKPHLRRLYEKEWIEKYDRSPLCSYLLENEYYDIKYHLNSTNCVINVKNKDIVNLPIVLRLYVLNQSGQDFFNLGKYTIPTSAINELYFDGDMKFRYTMILEFILLILWYVSLGALVYIFIMMITKTLNKKK